ncbi:MAG: putative lipid II flippase FtsW [Pseudomonadales bacterium]|jgi:cell division protein FtsW|nr:putative lipid II flippase FtsW [Pseudomonadales bacterium]MDP7313958.1 putative lipid II flippase FtsW [Pseudomonadales bacterium]MDP7577790.1 putative lipid II flippase FtsW [Pseudomonadales bacterium]HJP52104.1 putative lipid II flippase FtsW [Pseudomonadales bacterium]
MNPARKLKKESPLDCPVDVTVAGISLLLLMIGIVMVGSASMEISARIYGDPFHLFIKHVVYVAISVGVAALLITVPVRSWQQIDWVLLLLSFTLLIAVLMPGVGRTVNGSTRWISLGFATIQGSEFVKLFAIVYISGYLVRRREDINESVVGFAKPLALVSLMVLLLLEQPDFGASVVIVASVMGVIFLAGVPLRHFLPIITIFVVITFVVASWKPYRLERITSFMDPWAHQFDGGYQLTQALIAFGRGEWFGLGLGNSIQKLFFLPEAHTDFMFSILAEELGAIGAIIVILAFAILVLRALLIGKKAQNQGYDFHAYLAFGIALLLGIQAVINIGVNIGLLPTKGLTLPFLSYGGNSLIISCALIAMLLRVEYECRDVVNDQVTEAKARG